MEFANLLYQIENEIATITVNRPQALNALNSDTLQEIEEAVKAADADDGVKVMIIRGGGEKAFVAGADIRNMLNFNALEGRVFGANGQRAFRSIELATKPVIAAINGFALGGGLELAMACDIRVCSERSKFGQPEVGLGVIPGFGGTQRLPRLVGQGRAMELLLSTEIIDAENAYRIGLVNHVTTVENLYEFVEGLARKISAQGQVAVRFCKLAVREGMQTDLDRAMSIEADIFGLCFATHDQKEGMGAFVEKRPTQFKGE